MPYKDKAKRAAYDATRPPRSGKSGKHRPVFVRGKFVGWDGEGVNDHKGHHYVLLAGSTGPELVSDGPHTLPTRSILDTFIDEHLRLREARIKPIHVTYGLSYDANQALRSLTRGVVDMIWNSEGMVEFVTGNRRYLIQYRKRKSLYIARYRSKQYKLRWIPDSSGNLVRNADSMTIWDVQGFFQTSFVNALTEYFPNQYEKEIALIEEMKKRRDIFSYNDLPEIRAYNQLELQLLVKLMDKLREHLGRLGLPITQWHGAGAIAITMMQQNEVKLHHEPTPYEFEDEVRRAYFGGRIEIAGQGRLTEFYHADQRSAYPYAIAKLPSLEGAYWTRQAARSDGRGRGAPMILRRVKWALPANMAWYPLPYRSPGYAIAYPQSGDTYVWDPEYDACMRYIDAYGGYIETLDTIYVYPVHAHKPFAFLPRYYEERKLLETAGDGAQFALKFGMNSIAGKLMQQLGGRVEDDGTRTLPPYHQLAWAGWVTSFTRAALIDAALSLADDRDLVFFATDSIVARSPIDVPFGEGIGQWKADEADELIVLQPGVYWTRHGEEWQNHTRGFPPDKLGKPDRVLEAWRQKRRSIKFKTRRFLTMGSALAHEELWPEWCQWWDTWHVLDLTGGSSKRHGRGHRGRSPARGWVPLAPMLASHYELTGDTSHPAPLLWADQEPDDMDSYGVSLRTIEYEEEDSYT